jgi:hypothetical protein
VSDVSKLNWRRLLWNCRLEYLDAKGQPAVAKGRRMVVDGMELELFPSSTLCAVLHRSLRCLYTWERDFGFPPAMWRIRDDKVRNRWYSRKQIQAVLGVYERFGRLRGDNRANLRRFVFAVRAVFFVIDLPKRKESA